MKTKIGNVAKRFNNEFNESFFKSEKTNFGLFSSLISMSMKGRKLKSSKADMTTAKDYLRFWLKNNNNSFEHFGKKSMPYHVNMAISYHLYRKDAKHYC